MVIRFIDKGTLFYITVIGNTPDLNVKLNGTLYATERNVNLLVEGVELCEYFIEKIPGRSVQILFYHEAKEYSFFGKFVRTLTKQGVDLVEFEATTGLEEKTRRSTLRLELSLPVNMYVQTNDNTQDLVCSGRTVDISSDAICFLSNEKFSVPKESRFFVEFTLCKTERFNLPAKLVKCGDSPQSVQYKYDYVLIFNFTEAEAEKSRLITAFFKHNLEARK